MRLIDITADLSRSDVVRSIAALMYDGLALDFILDNVDAPKDTVRAIWVELTNECAEGASIQF